MASSPPVRPLAGIFITLAAILGAYLLEGGHFADLLQPSSLLVVVGPTVGVLLMGCGLRAPLRQLRALRRQDGVSDWFALRRALHLVVSAAPLSGLAGSVLGMIEVMGNLSDPARLGAGLAIALTSTFYGLILAMVAYGLLAAVERRMEEGEGSPPTAEPSSEGDGHHPFLGAAIVLGALLAAYLLEGGMTIALTNLGAGVLVCGAWLGGSVMPCGFRAPCLQLPGLLSGAKGEQKNVPELRAALRVGFYMALVAGLVGSILGFLHVLRHLDDPTRLGAGVALAFVALLYATVIALLVQGCLSLAKRERAESPDIPIGYGPFYSVLGVCILLTFLFTVLYAIKLST